jgi:hypothetical protein
MRLLVLGAVRGLTENRWKDDIAEAAERLGWDATHVNARGIDAEDVVRQAKGTDLFIWARTHGHRPDGDVAGMLRRIEDAGTATVGLHLDLYWGIQRREGAIGVDPWWTCQYVFTADGGRRDWASRGVNHHWCPPAMGHRFYGSGQLVRQYRHRAVFVGGLVRDIHGYHRVSLLRWARRQWQNGFVHYGVGRRRLWGQALSDLYASADLVVGDSAWAPRYWSDRVPCTLGRGALFAYPRTPGLTGQGFTDDTMILYDRFQFGQIAERVRDTSPAQRRQMRENALTVIAERHMWSHRLRQIGEVACGS